MGYIYILTNEMFNDFVKIDYTNSIERLLKHIEEDRSVPIPYKVYATYMVPEISEYRLIEALNVITQGSHTNGDFYKITPEEAYAKIEAIAQITGTLTDLSMWNNDVISDKVSVTSRASYSWSDRKLIPDGTYYLKRNIGGLDVYATADIIDGNWILKKGSIVSRTKKFGLTDKQNAICDTLPIGEFNDLTADVELGNVTPSYAGCIVTRGASNGWFDWKTEDRQPIDIFRH